MDKAIELINQFKSKKGYLHPSLVLSQTKDKGLGFFSQNFINKDTLLIHIPKKLIIQDVEKFFYDEINNKFFNDYKKIILTQSFTDHPLLFDDYEFKVFLDLFKENNLIIKNFYQNKILFNKLSLYEKKIKLITKTRGIFPSSHSKPLFVPVFDFFNHNNFGSDLLLDKDGNLNMYAKNDILINQQIFYNYKLGDSIRFYLTHGFIDTNNDFFSIYPNELSFNSKINIKNPYYISKGDKLIFVGKVNFFKNKISQDVQFLLSIFKKSDQKKVLIEILQFYLNAIDEDKLLKLNTISVKLQKINFVINSFKKNIKNYIYLIDRSQTIYEMIN